ncbi:MAG: hypothetical protein ACR2FG_03240 [Marmoricola sp.]
MGAVLGLTPALAFGVSDFVAGLAGRRLHVVWPVDPYCGEGSRPLSQGV